MSLKDEITKILGDVTKAESTKLAQVKELVQKGVGDLLTHPALVFAAGVVVGACIRLVV